MASTGPGVIGILVVNYFSAAAVGVLLNSLSNHAGQCTVHVAVVDNSCNTAEFVELNEVVKAYVSPQFLVRVEASSTNRGYAGGNNFAWSLLRDVASTIDVVVVANPDVEVTTGSLADLIHAVREQPNTVFGVSTITGGISYSGLGALNRRSGQSRQVAVAEPPTSAEFAYPTGHFLVAPRDLWEQLQGMSEDYFLYSEEIDLVLRAKEKNRSTMIGTIEAVSLQHSGGLTTGSGDSLAQKSMATYLHGTRSRIILFRKHPALKRYVPLIVSARLLWSLKVLGVAGYPSAKAVWSGAAQGLAWRAGVTK